MESQKPHVKVVKELLAKFHSGVYLAGDKLPNEREMAETFGVSRSAVRYAKAVLLAQGLIKNVQGTGSFVWAVCA